MNSWMKELTDHQLVVSAPINGVDCCFTPFDAADISAVIEVAAEVAGLASSTGAGS